MDNDNDFLLDDEDDVDSYVSPDSSDEDSDDEDNNSSGSSDEESGGDKEGSVSGGDYYNGALTPDEIWMNNAYDDIALAITKDTGKTNMGGGRSFDASLVDAVRTVVMANPKHTAQFTVENIVKALFQTQGHARIVSSLYTPETMLREENLDSEFLGGSDDIEFNKEYTNQVRQMIADFIGYLAGRDLSKDSIISRRRKERQIPAFIIFLFSSQMYDLIIDCPTMPKEYDDQIKNAMRRIQKAKDDVVEALAQRYEEHGRPEVAAMVRKKCTAWFRKEPAEIRTTKEYENLHLTQQDVVDYRDFRSRFINVSRSLTQDVISDMIEVVLDKDAGIYERLKDKTRADAIADVKQVWKDWVKDYGKDSELSDKIIWKDPELVNKTTN